MRLIDADHVLTLEEMQKMFTGETCCMKSSIQRVLSLFPTVDALPVVHAHYIQKNFDDYECSNCHVHCHVESVFAIYDNYCPNCGARMDGKE